MTTPLLPTTRLKPVLSFLIGLLIIGVNACSSNRSLGKQQRIRLSVGEIKEISMPSRGDNNVQLIGTSDNQEVVEVSRRELAPAVDTLRRDNSGSTIFQLKGVTVGTANVIFSEKKTSDQGNGQAVKTYVVQVISK